MKIAMKSGWRRKWISWILILAAGLFLLTGCEDGTEAGIQEAQKQNPDRPLIGLVFDSFVIERWERDRDIFVSMAKELGADVLVGNANGEAAEQKKILTQMIDRKVDVLVVIAVDGESLTDEVEKAHRAGIQVICYDRIISNANADLYITFDNETVGRYMAESINGLVPENGTYMKLKGSPQDHNVEMVNQGFDDTIREDLQMIDSMSCSNWNDEEAYEYLTAHPEDLENADAFMCGNDAIAGQVVRALAEKRMAGKRVVTGQDADLDACQRIVEGTQNMTVYKPIEDLAGKAAEYAVAMAQKDTIQTEKTISDGTYEVPYVSLSPIQVTKNNMDGTIIAKGFHMEEDVYLHAEHDEAGE